jgi:phytoene synthase
MSQTTARRAARLYRFCRHVDDLVDLATDTGKARKSVSALIQSIVSELALDPITGDAIELFQECKIPPWIPIELLRGVESDIDLEAIRNEEELLRYCFRVAGTVGLMMCHVMNVMDETARRHAVDLGIAMQLTNIIRDVSEDARLGRLYLPDTRCSEITTANILLADDDTAKQIAPILTRLHALSESYYASGFKGLPFIPLGSRYAILVAGHIYRQIGFIIKARGFDYRGPRAVVSLPAKTCHALGLILVSHLSPRFWITPVGHDPRLHAALDIYPISPNR